MLLKRLLQRFRKTDDGATTVDWIVLTAAMTVLAATGYLATERGVTAAADAAGNSITAQHVR